MEAFYFCCSGKPAIAAATVTLAALCAAQCRASLNLTSSCCAEHRIFRTVAAVRGYAERQTSREQPCEAAFARGLFNAARPRDTSLEARASRKV